MVLELTLEMTQGLILFLSGHLSIYMYILKHIKEHMPYGNSFHLYNVCEKLFLFYPLRIVKMELNSLLLTCWP